MKIFAIGDLHLSTAINKPMDVFGNNWENHETRIFEDWHNKVKNEDVVFIVGDISWASKLDDAKLDLDKISELPGKKILIRGNHDYWWTTASGLNKHFDENMCFMNTEPVDIKNFAICATRGWITPNDINFTEKDLSIYKREAHRLNLSLEEAKKRGYDDIIVLLHYPPTNKNLDDSLFMDVIMNYKPKHVIYGHLHGEESFDYGIQGEHEGINFHLVSSDYLGFKLKEILEV